MLYIEEESFIWKSIGGYRFMIWLDKKMKKKIRYNLLYTIWEVRKFLKFLDKKINKR